MSELTRLILFRHGETDWNKAHRWQGHSDIPLNETGKQQAAKLAKLLEAEGVEHIYSSDLQRAIDTAAALANLVGCKISTDPRLRELNLGDAEGLHLKSTDEIFGAENLARFFSNEDVHFGFPNGETKDQHRARMVACIEDYAPAHKGKTIAFSTHGGSLHRLFCAYWTHRDQIVQIPNCAQIFLNWHAGGNIVFEDTSKPPFRGVD